MKETLFMGKMTATATHEIKNVLAIIRESSGLMQDFLYMLKDEKFEYKERFLKIISNIDDQVTRGDGISTLLNKFAHAPDQESSTENLPEVVDQMIALSVRLAKAKEVSFVNDSSAVTTLLTCDPLKTRMLLFQAMDTLMGHALSGEKVGVKVSSGEAGKALIEFHLEPDKSGERSSSALKVSEQWRELKATADEMKYDAEFDPESGVLKLELNDKKSIGGYYEGI